MKLADYIGKYWTGAEVMYAIIIAMTFTSTLRGYFSYSEKFYDTVIYTAFFCCVAWGIADGLFYAWERNYIFNMENNIIEYSKSTENNATAISLIGEQLDDTILRNINEKNRVELYRKLVERLGEVGKIEKPSPKEAFFIILATSLIATLTGLIVVAPFFIIESVSRALNVSNLLGIFLLFIIGYNRAYKRNLSSKLVAAFGTAAIGILIAIITTLLGG